MRTLDLVQVGTENTTKKELGLSKLESVALGLLALATKSEVIQKKLMQGLYEYDLIMSNLENTSEESLDFSHIEWIPFINTRIAESKLFWLINEINHASDEERQRVVKILSYTYRNPVPQMAAWGFIFNETLGVFVAGHPFNVDMRLEYSQVIIVGPNWRQLEPQNLAKQVSRISLMALSKCIEEANFNLKRIEPEVSSWLLEGSGLELYCAKDEEELNEILIKAQNCGLLCSSISEEVKLIALQPSVSGSYETLLAKLTAL